MMVRWHGHACFEVSDSKTTVVIDPHDGRSIGIKPPVVSADVVLMTHDHYDHNAARVVKGRFDSHLGERGDFESHGIHFEGLPAWHDASEGAERGPDTIYIFEMDGVSVCHCGDLGCIPDPEVVERIHGVNILMVPTGQTFTLRLPEVKRFIELVNPDVIIPMHYRVGGLTLPVSSIDEFLEMIPEEAVDYVGNEIDVSPEDFDGVKRCWVFDR